MPTTSTLASNSLPKPHDEGSRPRRQEDVVYQGVTIAAILLVLGSVWVF
jgi:hypothetical protein